ncbi:MAG: hypothetical protein ACK4OM_02730 [Alphaproteobacteria bacterium]
MHKRAEEYNNKYFENLSNKTIFPKEILKANDEQAKTYSFLDRNRYNYWEKPRI